MAHAHGVQTSHDHELRPDAEQRRVALSLILSFIGGALIINSYIAPYMFPDAYGTPDPNGVDSLCAFVGAVLLARSLSGRRLSAVGLARDLVACAAVDTLPIVAELDSAGVFRKLE